MTGIDTTVPHSARLWSYWLGGKDCYEIDRQVGDHIATVFPGICHEVRCSRYFLARAVRYLAAHAGIRQFLDIGARRPTGCAARSRSPASSTAFDWTAPESFRTTRGGPIRPEPAASAAWPANRPAIDRAPGEHMCAERLTRV